MAAPAAKKQRTEMPPLGSKMSLDDARYTSGAAFIAGDGSGPPSPDCDCPGFDPALMTEPGALLGRWVRSPSKFVGWDVYMEFFGLRGDRALQETEEPQEHVLKEFSKGQMRILHRLPWRDGLDCEYTVPIDGSAQPVPPAMVARASSSWKVNDLANWAHAWDDGSDGNPLHRGLRTEQKLNIAGTEYALRYWRHLISPREMRINVEVTYLQTGKYAVHTQRFFHKIDVERIYAVASPKAGPGAEESAAALRSLFTATYAGKGVRLAVLPHASNMPAGWEARPEAERWELAEPFPTAGRSSGPFLTSVRDAARETGLWVVVGVVLRTGAEQEQRGLLRCAALIGNDGWLHGVHADAAPPAPYVAGGGEWPATQNKRPVGVVDTAVGRVSVLPDAGADLVAAAAAMGAELIVAPPPAGAPPARGGVALPAAAPHQHLTDYALCGPDPLPARTATQWAPVVVAAGDSGALVSQARPVPCP